MRGHRWNPPSVRRAPRLELHLTITLLAWLLSGSLIRFETMIPCAAQRDVCATTFVAVDIAPRCYVSGEIIKVDRDLDLECVRSYLIFKFIL